MTHEEAIKVLETLKSALTVFGLHEAVDMAIKALERQTPRKVIEVSYGVFPCPNCGNTNIGIEHKYCPDCGQAIDWSDEE